MSNARTTDRLREKLLDVRKDRAGVFMTPTYGMLSYRTPAHPKHALHHVFVPCPETAEEVGEKVQKAVGVLVRAGLEPDGSNADTWTGAEVQS